MQDVYNIGYFRFFLLCHFQLLAIYLLSELWFLKGWVKSPQMLLIFLYSFFCRGPSVFCLSLHMTHKAASFQLSLKERWLRKMQSCAFPDHDSILKTRNISGLLSVLFLWMHVKGWRAGFLPPLPDSLLPKSQGLWFDRDLCGCNGRGENGRLQLTAPLPWATGIAAHGSGRVILHGFYKMSWKNLAELGKQTLGMICSYLFFVSVKGWLQKSLQFVIWIRHMGDWKIMTDIREKGEILLYWCFVNSIEEMSL